MTEHIHHEQKEHVDTAFNQAQNEESFYQHSIPISIMVGSLIIAASIFYNTGVVLKKLGLEGQVVKTAQETAQNNAQVQNQPSQVPAAPQNPSNPVEIAVRGDAPVLGNKNAKVTLVEFSDFQCPFCKRFYEDSFKQLKSKYIDTGKVKVIFRHFPLPFHQNATIAAQAAECANRQGKFWQYHDLLFKDGQSDGTNLDAVSLKKYANQLGLEESKFNQCLNNNETADIVKKDTADGSAAGVSGTPTLFVNGKIIVGAQPVATFEQAIEEALK